MFAIWSGQLHRATQDLDFLSSGAVDVAAVEHVFQEICRTPVEDDGLQFVESSVRADKTRDDQQYEGLRVQLAARLGAARIPLQVDIGFGDAITPGPIEAVLPTLLDFPAPQIASYPRETAIAEKFQAMVMLGLANSRMKDFYDLWYLAQQFSFDGETLSRAIEATFSRRKTRLPTETPFALTSGFTQHLDKQKQWAGFLKKTRLPASTMSLDEIAPMLVEFLMPPTLALVRGEHFNDRWVAAGSWQLSS